MSELAKKVAELFGKPETMTKPSTPTPATVAKPTRSAQQATVIFSLAL
jgi:hypothetical protein